jgi:hypothetical protein
MKLQEDVVDADESSEDDASLSQRQDDEVASQAPPASEDSASEQDEGVSPADAANAQPTAEEGESGAEEDRQSQDEQEEQEEGVPTAEKDEPEAAEDGQSQEEDGSDFGYDMYGGGDGEQNDEDAEPEYDAEDADGGEDLSESGESVDSEDEHALAVPLQKLQAVLGSPQSLRLESMAARQEQQEQPNSSFDAREGDGVDSFDSPFPPALSDELVLDSSLDLSPVYPPSATSEEGGLGGREQNAAMNQDPNGDSNGGSERTPLAASAARRGMPLPRHPANRSPASPTVADLIDHFSSPLLARSADRESRRLSRRKDSLYM